MNGIPDPRRSCICGATVNLAISVVLRQSSLSVNKISTLPGPDNASYFATHNKDMAALGRPSQCNQDFYRPVANGDLCNHMRLNRSVHDGHKMAVNSELLKAQNVCVNMAPALRLRISWILVGVYDIVLLRSYMEFTVTSGLRFYVCLIALAFTNGSLPDVTVYPLC
ncbi:hypothetical protein CC1G_14451 [Coprinopsis cinerea okayama7|uniref:Uncharacterized protein n=1 Tax=Coprinopsis cinerea (strain Okayama-7 / 130 / ATCC MYA-4618 / FGSC 9003) TaxID=240176 RepID=D6RLU5_COPC7|nr:hypothetical protein CC1G_14451 [Coprinopsis cinerea okayama7\|eukprot:XP_002911453.1 hypothetical protein CC1G_14451 [Coprinopsis cinerea okayama7\